MNVAVSVLTFTEDLTEKESVKKEKKKKKRDMQW